MLITQRTVQLDTSYDITRIGPAERLAFFDIETTGFSPFSSNLYLIGCLSAEQGGWQLTQWFSDSIASEQEVLEAFFYKLTSKNHLIHFNGDGFDIPYLTKCAAQYGIPAPFKALESFDIYKRVKSLKKLLALPNVKQKSIEQFLNIGRRDRYDGGQLIPIYKQYLKTRDEKLLQDLLLHNEEDVLQMPRLLSVLNYQDIPRQNLTIERHFLSSDLLTIEAKNSISLPAPFSCQLETARLEGSSERLRASIPVFEQELKYFYPDYKNYYYLPKEDTAIHKKIAQFVDKDYRTAATRSTCYMRRTGRYLPNPNPKILPAFVPEYKSKSIFTPWEEGGEFLSCYLQQLLLAVIG